MANIDKSKIYKAIPAEGNGCIGVKTTNEEQILNGFAEMMKGLWGNQNLKVPMPYGRRK